MNALYTRRDTVGLNARATSSCPPDPEHVESSLWLAALCVASVGLVVLLGALGAFSGDVAR